MDIVSGVSISTGILNTSYWVGGVNIHRDLEWIFLTDPAQHVQHFSAAPRFLEVNLSFGLGIAARNQKRRATPRAVQKRRAGDATSSTLLPTCYFCTKLSRLLISLATVCHQ